MKRTVKYVILLFVLVLLFTMVCGCVNEERGITALYNKGCKMMDRDLEGSIEIFSQVIELDPGFVDAYVNRGAALGELGRYDEAMADFNKAIQLDPDCYEAYYNRYYAKKRLGDIIGAEKDLDRFQEIKRRVKGH